MAEQLGYNKLLSINWKSSLNKMWSLCQCTFILLRGFILIDNYLFQKQYPLCPNVHMCTTTFCTLILMYFLKKK